MDIDCYIEDLKDELKDTKGELEIYKEFIQYVADIQGVCIREVYELISCQQYDKARKGLFNEQPLL
jgi:hypothetical protein